VSDGPKTAIIPVVVLFKGQTNATAVLGPP
jgi:hypothetical protein